MAEQIGANGPTRKSRSEHEQAQDESQGWIDEGAKKWGLADEQRQQAER